MAVKHVFKKASHVIADMVLLEGPGIEPYIMREYEKAVNDITTQYENRFTEFYLQKYPFKTPYIAECWLERKSLYENPVYKQYADSIRIPEESSEEALFKPIPVLGCINTKLYCLHNYGADRLGIFEGILTKKEYEEMADCPIFIGDDPSDYLILQSERDYESISVELYSPTRVINLIDPIWHSPKGVEMVNEIMHSPIKHTHVYIKVWDNELYFDDIDSTYAEVYRKYITRLIDQSSFSEGKTFSAKKIQKKFWKDVEGILDNTTEEK